MPLALITGASSGLGRALSSALAQEGYSLLLVARHLETMPHAELFEADLTLPESRARLIQKIHDNPPDLLINSAGFGLYGPTLSHKTRDSQEMVQLNIDALMELSIEGARALKNTGKSGIILNISSAAAFFPLPSFCVYAASKAFVNSFSLALDKEMQPYGIRVLTACPGRIATSFQKRASVYAPTPQQRFTIPLEKATRLILKQIRKRQALRIIDWRYGLLVFLGKWLPTQFMQWLRK